MAKSNRVLALTTGLVAVGVLFLLAACSDDAVPPGRTGIAIIDTVLEAIERNEPDDLVSLVKLEDIPCVRGGPTEITPVCADDQETGTLVETFAEYVCVGLQLEATTERQMANWIVDQDLSLYGVYELPEGDSSDTTYNLLFNHPVPASDPEAEFGLVLRLSGQQILSSLSHCGNPASKFSEFFDLGEPILEAG